MYDVVGKKRERAGARLVATDNRNERLMESQTHLRDRKLLVSACFSLVVIVPSIIRSILNSISRLIDTDTPV